MDARQDSPYPMDSVPPEVHQDVERAPPHTAWNHMQNETGAPQPQPYQHAQQEISHDHQQPSPHQWLTQPLHVRRQHANDWRASYCGCFDPFSLCLEAFFCPCIVHGRTYHRIRNDGDMTQYDHCNAPCWIYGIALNWGFYWIPVWLQRSNLRDKHNLSGNCLTDCLSACLCPLCDIVQVEKEAERLEGPPGHAALGYQRYDPMVATNKHEGV